MLERMRAEKNPTVKFQMQAGRRNIDVSQAFRWTVRGSNETGRGRIDRKALSPYAASI